MPKRSRAKIRRLLLARWKNLIDEETLRSKIDDFVDEYLEKCEFFEKYTVDQLPSRADIKWWFQEKPEAQYVEQTDGSLESNYEMNIDAICLEDSLATDIFKYYYNWYWENGCEIPYTIQKMIDVYKKFKRARSEKKKSEYKERLANLALVGIVRLNKLERKPYMCPTEIMKCSNHLIESLEILSRIGTKREPKSLPKKLYIFDAFGKMQIEE